MTMSSDFFHAQKSREWLPSAWMQYSWTVLALLPELNRAGWKFLHTSHQTVRLPEVVTGVDVLDLFVFQYLLDLQQTVIFG
jgi:hypothetical protein